MEFNPVLGVLSSDQYRIMRNGPGYRKRVWRQRPRGLFSSVFVSPRVTRHSLTQYERNHNRIEISYNSRDIISNRFLEFGYLHLCA